MTRAELTPFEKLLYDDEHTSTPVVHDPHCYICNDSDFAQMGLPLCNPCPRCQAGGSSGHIPADDQQCSVCGYIDDPFDGEDPVRNHNHERGAMLDRASWVVSFLARAWSSRAALSPIGED